MQGGGSGRQADALRAARGRTLLGVVAVAIAGRVWAPILRNYFAGDDFRHFYHLVNFGPLDFVLSTYGGHMYVFRNLVMTASFALFGLEPRPFFAGVLATHMANTALVFLLAGRIARDTSLAFLAAILFAVSPTHAPALGWYSVYGYALACFFTLLALWLLVPAPGDPEELTLGRAVLVATVALAASQSFGAGAGTALVMPLVAVALRPSVLFRPTIVAVLCAVPAGVVAAARFLFLRPSPTNSDPGGSAALLLSFVRDVPNIVPMTVHLAGLGVVSLVLQSTYPLAAYPNAAAVLVLLAFVVSFVLTAVNGDGARRRALVALVIVLAATCGAIAAGRATMMHLTRPDGVVGGVRATPRYFYMIHAIGAVLIAVVLEGGTRGRPGRVVRTTLVVAGTIVAVGGWMLRPPAINHWNRQRDLVARAERTIVDEVATRPPGTTVCMSLDGRDDALVIAARAFFPGYAAIFMMLQPSDVVDGRRVVFTSADEDALAARTRGGRVASLLMPAGSCPP
jgi:hypothetical protein